VIKKICFVSGSRSDYGLLHNLMKLTQESKKTKLQLVLTGMHLEPKFGNTFREIKEDGFKIDYKVKINLKSDKPLDINKATSQAIIGLSNAYLKLKPNLVVILGDRFEMLAAAFSAFSMQIPITHIHGGESSFGSLDEGIRHSITKMAICHFVSTSTYRKRVIQLGENPSMVFNYGALAYERIKELSLFNKTEIEQKFKFKFDKNNILITYHPATLSNNDTKDLDQIFLALDKLKNTKKIFTMPNADTGSAKIISMIKNYVKKNKRDCIYFKSLGQRMYFSFVNNCDLVLGNSSSGIIEVPFFKKPSIDVGIRQLGRIKCKSTVNVVANYLKILQSVKKVLSKSFLKSMRKIKNPYQKDETSKKIFKKILNLKSKNLLIKKFYDM
jgi:GDP/UDP-N,N'-diacetylbacillosamine 2-epimerase (hydrolysing)